MKQDEKYKNQKYFWEEAGKVGYDSAMFSNQVIENHIMTKHWQAAIDAAKSLGLDENSKILELGCGDGKFSENILAVHFKHIDAFDMSKSAIKRAQSLSNSEKVSYFAEDVTNYEYEKNAYWDGAFMMGFLHHVRAFAPEIVSRLAMVCHKVIVVDPNGNNIMRKLLESLPSYKRAGEDSFQLEGLMNIFSSNGYQIKMVQRLTFIPPFLPKLFFPFFKKLEGFVESSSFLNKMCSTYILGFERA